MYRYQLAIIIVAIAIPYLSVAQESHLDQMEVLALKARSSLFSSISSGLRQESKASNDNSIDLSTSYHLDVRLGLEIWKGSGQVYAGTGVIRKEGSLMIAQKRPYIGIDAYPFLTSRGQLSLYYRCQLPFSDSSFDETIEDPTKQGSIHTFGISPRYTMDVYRSSLKLGLRTSVDSWTELYSRQQYVPAERSSASLSLYDEDLEDRYSVLSILGGIDLMLSPSLMKSWLVAIGYRLKIENSPYYFLNSENETKHKYIRSTYSFYRLKLKMALSKDLVIDEELLFNYSDLEGSIENTLSIKNLLKIVYHI